MSLLLIHSDIFFVIHIHSTFTQASPQFYGYCLRSPLFFAVRMHWHGISVLYATRCNEPSWDDGSTWLFRWGWVCYHWVSRNHHWRGVTWTPQQHPHPLQKQGEQLMNWNESTIILAIIGMVGLFSTAIIWQRSNRITSKYYNNKWLSNTLTLYTTMCIDCIVKKVERLIQSIC